MNTNITHDGNRIKVAQAVLAAPNQEALLDVLVQTLKCNPTKVTIAALEGIVAAYKADQELKKLGLRAFLTKLNAETIKDQSYSISLLLPSNSDVIEILRQAQKLGSEVLGVRLFTDKALADLIATPGLDQPTTNSRSIRIQGFAESTVNESREKQKGLGALGVTDVDFALAHAAYFLITRSSFLADRTIRTENEEICWMFDRTAGLTSLPDDGRAQRNIAAAKGL